MNLNIQRFLKEAVLFGFAILKSVVRVVRIVRGVQSSHFDQSEF